MTDEQTIWGIHMEWDDGTSPPDTKDIAIGWEALGDLNALPSSRDAFKAAFTAAHDREGDARHFIGERDGDKLEGLALHELLRKGSQRVVVWLAMIENRMRAQDK
jgi:hypothetical protein